MRARAGYFRPLSEPEIGNALDQLEAMHRLARENVALQGRDIAAAGVLITTWRDELAHRGIRRERFRLILVELERRSLVAVDGPFVKIVDERGAAADARAGEAQSSPSNRTSGARA